MWYMCSTRDVGMVMCSTRDDEGVGTDSTRDVVPQKSFLSLK